eukprot:m.47786 g.47786  ORF g.47786 m.47786 type:complete len:82 (+) comp11000_c0_seq2:867-1112(+)
MTVCILHASRDMVQEAGMKRTHHASTSTSYKDTFSTHDTTPYRAQVGPFKYLQTKTNESNNFTKARQESGEVVETKTNCID